MILQKSFNEHGEGVFHSEILEVKKNLREREEYWINYYDSYNNGYNSTIGGIGCKGFKWEFEKIINRPYSNQYEIIKEVKIRLSNGEDILKLAEEYKIHKNSVSNIKQCRNWAFIMPELNNKLKSMCKKLNFDLANIVESIKIDLFNNLEKKHIIEKYNINSRTFYAIVVGRSYKYVLSEYNDTIKSNYLKK
jgi:predicted transcriptional regulator